MKTAEARSIALRAEEKADWKTAAKYYEIAINNYPDLHKGSESYNADIEFLKRNLAECNKLI